MPFLGVLVHCSAQLRPPPPLHPPFEPLYVRISRARNPRVTIVPILNQWVDEGRDVKKWELQRFVKLFRKHRRYSHALQVVDMKIDYDMNSDNP